MKHDEPQTVRNIRWAREVLGADYGRMLGMVGHPDYWGGREIDPFWPDYEQVIDRIIDTAYDQHGLRLQITLFADAQVMMPDRQDRDDYVGRWIRILKRRPDAFMHVEVANEYWQNGLGVAELREHATRLVSSQPVLVAASAPGPGHEPKVDWRAVYEGLPVQVGTVHFDRDISKVDGHWRPVRQPWEYQNTPFAMPPLGSNNEPIGPGASVAEDDDPVRLAAAAAFTWMAGLPFYVYHPNAGIRGDYDFADESNAQAIAEHLRAVRGLLPADIANWDRYNHHWAGHPFEGSFPVIGERTRQLWPDGLDAHGMVRCIACRRGRDFYVLTIGIRDHVDLAGPEAMTFSVFALDGTERERVSLAAGETYQLGDRDAAVLIKGQVK